MANLSEIIKKGKKLRGDNTYLTSREIPSDFPRVPTGIFALDYAIGGGFPVGVTSSVYGPPSGGKTTVCSKLMAGAQNICWNCFHYLWECTCENTTQQDVVLVATEINDMDWSAVLGVDLDRVTVVEPSSGEQAVDVIVECLRADDCGLVLLDSLPMLTPTVELEASAEEVQVGAQAKLISKMLRRVKTTLIREKKRGHRVMFVATNQVRAKIGGYSRGPAEEVPGGFTSKHDWHLMFRTSQLSSTKKDPATDMLMEAKFSVSMKAMGNKSKLLTLAGSAEYFLSVSDSAEYLKGTINDYKTVFAYGEEAGLITRDPWACCGDVYDKKVDIMEAWLDTEYYLTVKRKIIDFFITRYKNGG